MLYKVVLTLESLDKILWCDHSNETSSAVFLHGTICFSIFYKIKCGIFLELWYLALLGVKGLSFQCKNVLGIFGDHLQDVQKPRIFSKRPINSITFVRIWMLHWLTDFFDRLCDTYLVVDSHDGYKWSVRPHCIFKLLH